uniref:Retrovirus-related Pol polyprotein from transposon TNT 1-94 n=1 Tax=Cajanus cajan TaxID=3821 RepID=A0A151TKR3_CAJCA|nr:Retrovirus-related Pol polyprotein from transposon TNT 1-94 [Cajanus cajan]
MYEESSGVEVEVLLVAYEETNHQSVQQKDWFLDSGCSNHMTGNKRWFTKIHEQGLCNTVKLGNDTTMTVEAKGDIRVSINGCSIIIIDVYYVPELRTNLLSLGRLQEKGLAVLIQNDTCKIFHPDRGLLLHSSMKGNRMFYLTSSMNPRKS